MTGANAHVMIVAGEASGDQHGAAVIRELLALRPGLRVSAVGGRHLREAGAEPIFDAERLSVVGLTEVLAKAPDVLAGWRAAKAGLFRRPDLLILVDFPDFNLRLAGVARELGLRVLYYISPQIWAWRRGRVHAIRRLVDHMAVILPFEADFYRRQRVPVTFVGHPLLDHLPEPRPRSCPGPGEAPVVGLLPGSREGEVRRFLPLLVQAARHLAAERPGTRFLLSRAASVPVTLFREVFSACPPVPGLEVVDGLDRIMAEAHAAAAASGTVTLQMALAGIPMTVIYTVSPLSYSLGRALIRVPHISLVNLIAGRELAPELIQDQAHPERIGRTLSGFFAHPDRYAALCRDLAGLRRLLGGPGAAGRVARIADGLLRG